MHAADLLTGRARLTPHGEALFELHSNRRFTYDKLNRRANRPPTSSVCSNFTWTNGSGA
jgi:hypothetical protein